MVFNKVLDWSFDDMEGTLNDMEGILNDMEGTFIYILCRLRSLPGLYGKPHGILLKPYGASMDSISPHNCFSHQPADVNSANSQLSSAQPCHLGSAQSSQSASSPAS